jgi:hypothetical protein
VKTASKATDALYKAVQEYVEECGGKLLAIGGVEVQQWPGDRPGKFRLAVVCLGTMQAPGTITEGGTD